MMKRKNIPEYRTAGAVYTRPNVVRYMLQEVISTGGFEALSNLRILEPSCGEGAFVLQLIDTLVSESPDWHDRKLNGFLRAFDVSPQSLAKTKDAAYEKLSAGGCPSNVIERLFANWFLCEDFLLKDFTDKFDIIIGNPPYIRFDTLDSSKQSQYKRRFKTFSERCDIYVPFFEHSLSLLSEKGVLSFICSNRFVRCSYGRRLRKLINCNYHVALYLNMEHTQPFMLNVSAYPAIFVIDRHIGKVTYSGEVKSLEENTLCQFSTKSEATVLNCFNKWYSGEAPWITTDSTIRDKHEEVIDVFPSIEESGFGTKIGIGVASGADEIFLNPQRKTEIEKECLIPIVSSDDIKDGHIDWRDSYMLNPYDKDNDRQMLDLSTFPKTKAYLEKNSSRLKSRYCAKMHPEAWFRTLDRINYVTLKSTKILIPDIQRGGNIALDEEGKYYPHHNIYWITSRTWNMRVLCVLLRSSFVTNQIRRISTQIRGGSVRYQAQNLRNIHIPAWNSLDKNDIGAIADLYTEIDILKIDACVNYVLDKVKRKQPRKIIPLELNF